MAGSNWTWASWGLDEVLSEFPGLRIRPERNHIALVGELEFRAEYQGHGIVEDRYKITITIPATFPGELPRAYEVGARIPRTFHTNPDRSLCLGSPFRLHAAIRRSPKLITFIRECVVPYLYAYSYWEAHGVLPFGELSHGNAGLFEDYMGILGVADRRLCLDLIALAGMKRRVANRHRCPCHSGRRLGRCHHRGVNRLRRLAHRSWFRAEHGSIRKAVSVR